MRDVDHHEMITLASREVIDICIFLCVLLIDQEIVHFLIELHSLQLLTLLNPNPFII